MDRIDEKFVLKSKELWYKTVVDILIETKEIDKWRMPFFRTRYSNDSFFEDMNPIISLIDFDERRIIKVIQEEDESHYRFWFDKFDDKDMLCIHLSFDNFERAKKDIIKFLTKPRP